MIDRPFRILQVLPKLDTGGAERVVIEISEAITAAGHHSIIACESGALTQAALRTGAEIIALPLNTKSPLAMRRNAKRLAKVIHDQKIDILHAHSRAPAWSAYWATQHTKTHFVTTYHGTYSENAPFKRRYNAIMAAGDRVIAVSHFIGELVQNRHAVDEKRLRIIPGGVDTTKFNPAAVLGDRMAKLAREWRLPAGAPTIMLPGRLTSWKGQSLLITALAALRHNDAVAILVGGDQGRSKYTQSLVAQAEELGVADRLRLVGHNEDMPAAMMLADIVVNASTDPEAFGRTIVEAQAMGRMVIAADHGGGRETVIDGLTGFLFAPGDYAMLARTIDQAIDFNAEERIAWGQRARAMVEENYSMTAMRNAVLGVYAELLD
jgi:glycosyltransferase involved in cell wall biosynthesis